MGRKAKFDEQVNKKSSRRKSKKHPEPVFAEGLIGKISLMINLGLS